MNDLTIEIISLLAIILGLTLGFFFIFDYNPSDAFFLEENDNNAYLESVILKINNRDNYTLLTVYGCKTFDVYSKQPINKSINESLFLRGTFSDKLFIVEEYK